MTRQQLHVIDGGFKSRLLTHLESNRIAEKASMVRCVLKESFPHHRRVSGPQTSYNPFIPIGNFHKSHKVMIFDLEIYSGNSVQLSKSRVFSDDAGIPNRLSM